MTEFTPFPKIPRLFRDIVVMEKIDGTNASILVPEDGGPLLAGSRTRWVKPGDDNFGFAAWVKANEETLRNGLGPGHHFGEWWGKGIQRGYGLAEKRFSLFNTKRWAEPPPLCHVVPVLYRGVMSVVEIDLAVDTLALRGSVAAPGFMKPEGVVVFHTASGTMFKVTCEKDDKPKGAE